MLYFSIITSVFKFILSLLIYRGDILVLSCWRSCLCWTYQCGSWPDRSPSDSVYQPVLAQQPHY